MSHSVCGLGQGLCLWLLVFSRAMCFCCWFIPCCHLLLWFLCSLDLGIAVFESAQHLSLTCCWANNPVILHCSLMWVISSRGNLLPSCLPQLVSVSLPVLLLAKLCNEGSKFDCTPSLRKCLNAPILLQSLCPGQPRELARSVGKVEYEPTSCAFFWEMSSHGITHSRGLS